MAVILNIDKWIYFYYRIMAEHRIANNSSQRNIETIDLLNKRKTINIIHFMLMAAYAFYIIVWMVYGCTTTFE